MPTHLNCHVLNSYITEPTCHSAGYPLGPVCEKVLARGRTTPATRRVSFIASPAICPPAFHLPCGMGFSVPSPWPDQVQPILCTGSRGRLLKEWLSPNTNQVIDEECTTLDSTWKRLRQPKSGVGKCTFLKTKDWNNPKASIAFC